MLLFPPLLGKPEVTSDPALLWSVMWPGILTGTNVRFSEVAGAPHADRFIVLESLILEMDDKVNSIENQTDGLLLMGALSHLRIWQLKMQENKCFHLKNLEENKTELHSEDAAFPSASSRGRLLPSLRPMSGLQQKEAFSGLQWVVCARVHVRVCH